MSRIVIAISIAILCPCVAAATEIVVDLGGSGDYLTIAEGVDAASDGDTVTVFSGVYWGEDNRGINTQGKAIVVRAEPGQVVVMDCELADRGFLVESGETGDTVIDGLTIRNGYPDTLGLGGGGIQISNASPTVRNCAIEDCYASYGAGVNIEGVSSSVIEQCEITTCHASNGGGGIRASDGASPQVIKCTLSGNSAYWGGGMMSRTGSAPHIADCRFEGNSATYSGGLRCAEGSPMVERTVFVGNTAQSGGGMGSGYYSQPRLSHCAFYDNAATVRGAGFACGTECDLSYCTFVQNSGPGGSAIFCGEPAGGAVFTNCIIAFHDDAVSECEVGYDPTYQHCCVYGNTGTLCGNVLDNIYQDPMLCDLSARDLTIHEDSPCMPANNSWGEPIGAYDQGCSAPPLAAVAASCSPIRSRST